MKISIILPVYNKQKYLLRTLQLISEQSLNEFECILIDDGSDDNSGVICDDFAEKDGRFIVYHTVNSGVSHARNIGLSKATGDYITFIDADDEIHIDYLRNLYDCIENNRADLVISGYTRIWDDKEEKEPLIYTDLLGAHSFNELLPNFAYYQNKYGIYGWCWAKIFRRNLAYDIRFDESISLAEDLDFYLKLYPKIQSVYIDDKTYYYYRQEAINSLINASDETIDYLQQLRLQIKIYKLIQSNHAMRGENYEWCSKRIKDYIFFSIYHTNYKCLFDVIREIDQTEIPQLEKDRFSLSWRSYILWCYFNKHYMLLKIAKLVYDRVRKRRNNVH